MNGNQRARDFWSLTKPLIVGLLLITTYGGLVIGWQGWPPFSLTMWTLLGGALAAGGSSALNQYIDRELDRHMQRTAKRPLADGRLTDAEGLAFGLGLSLVSYYVLACFVNGLAALLSLAGIVYYVIVYSLWLKKATVQNIVIGGGAGAIPPLVGYAAATGTLDMTAVILFAIIFMWTPPHFWALAIVRMKDYERAGVPMMPVVRGELETTEADLYLHDRAGHRHFIAPCSSACRCFLSDCLPGPGWIASLCGLGSMEKRRQQGCLAHV